jgi:hypothetical protein
MPETLRAAVRDNDIGAMYLAGANPYLLRAHCLGLHFGTGFRDFAGHRARRPSWLNWSNLCGEPHAGHAELSGCHSR